jgi:peptidoglycan/LPS O-acetylase OafA/YrhL
LAVAIVIFVVGFSAGIDEPAFVPGALAILMLATALANDVLPILSRGPLHYLGQISYAVYLSHMFLYTLFKLFFVDDAANVGIGAGAGFIAMMLLISAALYHYLELPAQRWLNGLYVPQPRGDRSKACG